MNEIKTIRIDRMLNKKGLIKVVISIFTVFILYFLFLHVNIHQASHKTVPEEAEYLIVLGARVKGEIPSLSLQYRINAAAEYLSENQTTIAIVSGGQGPGEDISEAEAMKRGLTEKGIDESRIIMEDKSTSTYENIKFSKQLIPSGASKGLIVSNDFHLYRAILMGKHQDLEFEGLPAKTPKVVLVKSYVREYLAVTKYYLMYVFGISK